MENINRNIGKRLRIVRHIFNEGTKLSAEQFAHLLDITRDKLINYEIGRAAMPVALLYNLYKRGINPVYIISGDGSVFANNAEGNRLQQLSMRRQSVVSKIKSLDNDSDTNGDIPMLRVAAGRLTEDAHPGLNQTFAGNDKR